MGKANLPPIHPFNDLDPLLPSTQETQGLDESQKTHGRFYWTNDCQNT